MEADLTKNRRLAIVVQRYGEEVNGGAELAARWLAEHLRALAEVHVLTTCALDYTTWANHYPAGTTELNGVVVHRFPVDEARDWSTFRKLTGRLLNGNRSLKAQLDWLQQQGPFSTPLLDTIEASYRRFDAFIFFTYLYAPTFFGLPLVADKAVLVPTAHDEPYLYFPVFRSLFQLPRRIVYLTETEKGIVNRVTRNGRRSGDIVAGVGINVPERADGAAFRRRYQIDDDFLLYVGRIGHSKNVPELIDFFRRYRDDTGRPLKLVLIGRATIDIPQDDDVLSLGFLPEQDKFDAIRAAKAVAVPSLYESLSMITLEAWLMGRPVLANGRCAVLKAQCLASNAGLYYVSYDEFSAALDLLLDEERLSTEMGQNGAPFVREHYSWDVIIDKYARLLDEMVAGNT